MNLTLFYFWKNIYHLRRLARDNVDKRSDTGTQLTNDITNMEYKKQNDWVKRITAIRYKKATSTQSISHRCCRVASANDAALSAAIVAVERNEND